MTIFDDGLDQLEPEPPRPTERLCHRCQLVHGAGLDTCPNCAMWGAFIDNARGLA